MRYPLAAGICLLLCLSAFAASDKEETEAPEQPPAVSENQQNPDKTAPQKDTDASVESQNLPGIDSDQRPDVKMVPEQEIALRHKIHRVWLWQESRDCLWNMAKKYYGDPWQWKKIYLANRYQIDNPHRIFPRQILIIPPQEEPEY